MIAWLSANIGTILICLVLGAVVVGIIAVMARDKKKGKSACGGNCGHCPMGGSCHNR
jgi:hypothetical protein